MGPVMKRKHSIIVEVTFDRPVQNKDACYALREIIERADKERTLGQFHADVEKVVVKHADNVARGIEQRCVAAVAEELGVVV